MIDRLLAMSGLDWVGVGAAVWFTVVMVQAHFAQHGLGRDVDLYDVLLESVDGKRRITLSKLTGLATTCVGMWAFLYSLTSGHLDRDWTGIVAFVMAGWGYRLGDKIFGIEAKMPAALTPTTRGTDRAGRVSQ